LRLKASVSIGQWQNRPFPRISAKAGTTIYHREQHSKQPESIQVSSDGCRNYKRSSVCPRPKQSLSRTRTEGGMSIAFEERVRQQPVPIPLRK
jgi:hypothetical protein